MRQIHETVTVTLLNNVPATIVWRGTLHTVIAMLDSWSSRRAWWNNDEYRHYMLLHTTTAVLEVYRIHSTWILSRIAD